MARTRTKLAATLFFFYAGPAAADPQPIKVDVDTSHAVNRFSPMRAFGAGVDEVPSEAIPRIYSPANVDKMLYAGFGPVSYRLYTELSVEYWHWNGAGTWSDERHQCGYFTGSVADPIEPATLGYQLPYRGFTHDQGDDNGYSRLTDGDAGTFWKSNPYLSTVFTHEPDRLHPQWVVVDLGAPQPVDAIRLTWVRPYATDYQVQYWTGANAMADPAHGKWTMFTDGMVEGGHGGDVVLRLADQAVTAQYIRILMTKSSGPTSAHGVLGDIRTRVGYALAEVGVGTFDPAAAKVQPEAVPNGVFTDLVHHYPNGSQTATYVSSVDPWHTSANAWKANAQPGFDLVFRSGITRNRPAMVSVGVLYNTPDNAVAEIEYLENHGYPVSYVELGEEPDGQYMSPEDYGALYVQWAAALHRLDPKLKIGGPALQSSSGVSAWADGASNVTGWLKRFVTYVGLHGGLTQIAFYSCEHYPFSACDEDMAQLNDDGHQIQAMFDDYRAAGFDPDTPIFVTEFNVSSGYSSAQEEMVGALWHADFVGKFLRAGGSGLYFYEYEPLPIVDSHTCAGTYSLWTADNTNSIRQPISQFYSSQIMNFDWVLPTDSIHEIYAADVDGLPAGSDTVSAFALKRPDGNWSVMLVNKDPRQDYRASLDFSGGAFSGDVRSFTFGPQQYAWHPAGVDGKADPDGPIDIGVVDAANGSGYVVPASSIVVLVGRIGR